MSGLVTARLRNWPKNEKVKYHSTLLGIVCHTGFLIQYALAIQTYKQRHCLNGSFCCCTAVSACSTSYRELHTHTGELHNFAFRNVTLTQKKHVQNIIINPRRACTARVSVCLYVR